jgi:hypothetical protein
MVDVDFELKLLNKLISIVLAYLILTLIFLSIDTYYKIDDYGLVYNVTTVINDDLVTSTVYVKDTIVFILIYLFVIILLFWSLKIIQKIYGKTQEFKG